MPPPRSATAIPPRPADAGRFFSPRRPARPTLIRDHAKKNCGGYCSGSVISITPLSGTGYGAAGVFCHEFQHQYQFKNGNLNEWQTGKYKTSDKFLNDRIYEAAADTAKYQYMHEIKDKNPQAAHAYAMAMLSPGQRAYSAAKNKGKSEQECMLAGMQGYAKDFYTAHFYAKYYHSEIRETSSTSIRLRPCVGILTGAPVQTGFAAAAISNSHTAAPSRRRTFFFTAAPRPPDADSRSCQKELRRVLQRFGYFHYTFIRHGIRCGGSILP